ncbi:MAG: UTRA domain-containing protein [Hyphomicrobiales bacterium]|nr:UTRA domain-containing protein [Hyphomicrobiales bacterium]
MQTELLRRISERIWLPGELVPKEVELAAEFGCARATVNRAMREMANSGILSRKRKAGTRVAINPVRKATLDIPVIRLDIENRGASYRYLMLSREIIRPPPFIANRLTLGVDNELLHLRAVHFSDNQPFVYEERWVNPAAIPEILNADLSLESANEWLVHHALFTSGDISFSAHNATENEAEVFGIITGTALFVVERLTWLGTIPITSVCLSYAPGFKMHTDL